MLQTPDKLRQHFRSILELEVNQSYQDRAVDGGVGPFVGFWVSQLGSSPGAGWLRLAAAFEKYAAMSPNQRRQLVARALGALGVKKESAAMGAVISKSPALDLEVLQLPGIGTRRAASFRKLGIEKVMDLIHYFPRDWQDRSRMEPIASLVEGEIATFIATVRGASQFRTRQRLTITEIALQDSTGLVFAVYFNQPYQLKRFEAGMKAVFTGKVQRKRNQLQIMNPEVEFLPEEGGKSIHTGKIVPIYPLVKEVSQRVLRESTWQVRNSARHLEETLPAKLLEELALPGLAESLSAIHFPKNWDQLAFARKRLVFDEFFQIALAMAARRSKIKSEEAPKLSWGKMENALREALPFELTSAQERVCEDIQNDLKSGRPMHRLLQGDVGSGKTLVAVLALLSAVEAGYQGALMAPTEILADQHVKTLRAWLEPLGVEVLRLVQAQKGAGRREVLSHIESGQPLIAVGTQALIQESVNFGHLGLAVIDEQHRFGVMQRLTLFKKAKQKPHVLVMTATPIPRTLAMTVYGDLDVSVIDELPPGRTPIETTWLKPRSRKKAFDAIKKEVKMGRQVYMVYALVDESDKMQWKAASQMAEELDQDYFPEFSVALLHGRMKSEEKDEVMRRFKAGEIQVLCSTTVVEVGVDVPNATVMVIEDADRFGLAQLHQLRGRVGRGRHPSQCFLIGDPKTDEGKARLKAMEATSDGFKIAEEDLKLRGAGEIWGLRQSGLPDLKLGDLIKDQKILIEAKKRAQALVDEDPDLAKKEHRELKKMITLRFDRKLELGDVG